MSDDLYLIWSHEHGLWWGPNERGYVESVRAAGRYSRAQVADIVLDHVPAGEEVAVPLVHALSDGRGAVWGIPDELKDARVL